MQKRKNPFVSPPEFQRQQEKRNTRNFADTHTHTLFSPLTVNLMSVSNVLLFVSLMKAECVGEHFHHAWVHAVNPPEQHIYISTCTETHKRAHTTARGSGKCRNTIQDYTQGHTRALQSLNSVYLTSGQPICQSLPLHLSLSSSHMQMHFFSI